MSYEILAEQATVDPTVIQLIRRAVIVILLRPVFGIVALYLCVEHYHPKRQHLVLTLSG